MKTGNQKSDMADKTLADLLREIDRTNHQFGAQRSAAAEIVRFFEMEAYAITVEMLHGIDEQFRAFLLRKWKIKSARTYVSHLRRLVREAVALGWTEPLPKWPPEWALVLSALEHTRGQGTLIKYAVGSGITPKTLSDDDLTRLREQIIKAGRTDPYAKEVISAFKAAIREAKLQTAFPLLSLEHAGGGTPLDQLPEGLKANVLHFLAWRMEYSRRDLKQLRPISTNRLWLTISRLYGYRVDVRGLPAVDSLKDLLSEDLVTEYVEWKKKRVDGDPFYAEMRFFYASIKHYPPLKGYDLKWFPEACKLIQHTEQSKKEERKERRQIRFDKLQLIVTKLAMSFNHNL